jgi:ATP-dependent Zn protease
MSSSFAKKDRELQATAYHEAAHAVVALRLALKFRHVTINPGSDCLGHLLCSRLPKWFNLEINKSDRARMLAERHIIVDFAGQIAETRFLGKNPRFGMHEDDYHAVDLALYFCGSRKTCEAYLDYCFEASRDLVNSQLRLIEATATVLLVRQTLNYRDVLGLDNDAPRNSPRAHFEKLSVAEEE